ncbi:hypothetical protein [Desulfobotulus sp.]|uniref:hypothetical protein n=1 Tax=Desulfobotulus sp. TaxID=1940337 RepID=UPI002A369AA8|nr:hypothetical protein [Desulfobotulus sp.]MDY0162541.1 hypothetical protein [Desulfobotulus sp.]
MIITKELTVQARIVTKTETDEEEQSIRLYKRTKTIIPNNPDISQQKKMPILSYKIF